MPFKSCKMESTIRVRIPADVVRIHFAPIPFRKGMNLFLFTPRYGLNSKENSLAPVGSWSRSTAVLNSKLRRKQWKTTPLFFPRKIIAMHK